MASYQQMGYHSANLLSEPELQDFAGAILSPVDYSESEITLQVKSHEGCPNFDLVFDPQLYYPQSERGKLLTWDYFPMDFDSLDVQSISWWRELIDELSETCNRVQPDAACSPAFVPRTFNDDYFAFIVNLGNYFVDSLAHSRVRPIQTLLVDISDLVEPGRVMRITSILSRTKASSVYLIIIGGRGPRREFDDVEELKGAMKLIAALEGCGLPVLVGFTSSDVALWKAAGATSCSTGKSFNLRRFTKSRFEKPREGGVQIPYWFEESLMAFLRESDIIRVRKHGVLSQASNVNPFGQEILKRIDSIPGEAWLGLSWRQWLYAFAYLEQRIDSGVVDVGQLLGNADKAWRALSDIPVLMEEPENDGAWIQIWKRALDEYQATE
jgi:hypothetical protein